MLPMIHFACREDFHLSIILGYAEDSSEDSSE